ncbi:hypothetical protein [Limnofasciculus baicalensis]|uniref:Uncharacterized protein n=1 Tax=Limnofasciculus baicalensis BBK-W-15 TaxID=2699891 RepID=A0AAE3GSC3_9CYAN|nr:hypothetical protein [Limnofasciculus baicalensis]MCP2729619.1 hypothetical protein [Limnofasciculus baicalensis BBK-W-15]
MPFYTILKRDRTSSTSEANRVPQSQPLHCLIPSSPLISHLSLTRNEKRDRNARQRHHSKKMLLL